MTTYLIRSSTIITMDPVIGDLTVGDILIKDDRIVAVGPDLAAPPEAVEIDGQGRIAMPGLVNAHIHTWQTALRGIAADWTIPRYLKAMHAGLATNFTHDDIFIANKVGALTQLDAGTTTMADWCHNNPTPDHTDAAIDGLMATGVRAVFLHGSPKPHPKPGQPHFSEVPMPREEILRLRNGRLSCDTALIRLGLAVLGPQQSVQPVCDADFALARELGLIASMHVGGKMLTPDGFDVLAGRGLLGPHVNVVHGNALSGDTLGLLCDEGVSFSLTPEVELQMGFGNPLTVRLRALGATISLGSDVESDMAADMFGVLRMALQAARHEVNLTHRAAAGAPPEDITISTRDALEWATLGGARALGLEDQIGSIAPGKKADIVLIDARALNMVPVHDPVASIVLHAGPRNVEMVMVDGKILKSGGHLKWDGLTHDLERLSRSGDALMKRFHQGG